MAFVMRASKHLSALNKSVNPSTTFSTSAKSHAGWNKDFKPAPFPQTEKERLDAAKKYGILPAEYQPYADDGLGYGDYPKLEAGLGVESRDPNYPYDFPEHRRNFHQVLHADHEVYTEDRYSQPEQPRYSNRYYFLAFFGVMAGCLSLYYWLDDKRMFRPVIPKQYPSKDKKHYTFE